MRYAVILFLLGFALGQPRAEKKPEPAEPQANLLAPQEYIERCATEGGCRIYTRRDLDRMVKDIQMNAMQEGFRHGFQQGIQQSCRRGETI